ncbi:MAG: hypothetical protein WDN25_14130 [Acetobacteraceae bacterium]
MNIVAAGQSCEPTGEVLVRDRTAGAGDRVADGANARHGGGGRSGVPAYMIRLAVALALLAVAVPARAQVESREGIALQNQILELRRQVQNLQDQMSRGGGAPAYSGRAPSYPSGGGDLVPQLLSRVETLEEQVRQLRGRVDETQNQVQRQGAELSKKIDDMAFQTQGSGGGAPPPAPYPPPTPYPPSGSTPPPGSLVLTPPPVAPGGAPPAVPPAGPVRRTPELAIQEGNAAWRAATTPLPNRRPARCCPTTAPRRAPMTRSSCWRRRCSGSASSPRRPSPTTTPTTAPARARTRRTRCSGSPTR